MHFCSGAFGRWAVPGPLRAMDGPKRAYRDVLVGVSRKGPPAKRAYHQNRQATNRTKTPELELEPVGLHVQTRIILIAQQYQVLGHGWKLPVEEVLGGLQFALVEIAFAVAVG